MIGEILQFEDLQRMCRPSPGAAPPRLATVVRWAEDQGIRYRYDGQGGIWTTLAAVNAALGLPAANDTAPYDPSDLFGRQ
jgi:hypothetical protein